MTMTAGVNTLRTSYAASDAEAADLARPDPAAQLAALRAIVDDLDYGIVALDAQRNVQFVNRTFRRFWRVPDDVAESRPNFIKLMYHGRGIARLCGGAASARRLSRPATRSDPHRPTTVRSISGSPAAR